jgi:hypothetical protein
LTVLGDRLYGIDSGNEPDAWYNNGRHPNYTYAKHYMMNIHHLNLKRMRSLLDTYLPRENRSHLAFEAPSFAITYSNTPLYSATLLQQAPITFDKLTAHWYVTIRHSRLSIDSLPN